MRKYRIGILVFLLFIAVGASFTVTYFYLDGGHILRNKASDRRGTAVPRIQNSKASADGMALRKAGISQGQGNVAAGDSQAAKTGATTDQIADGPRVPQAPVTAGGRYVTIRGQYVAVYTRAPAEGGQLFQLHPINVAKLPFSERAQLERGIRVKDDNEVLDLLEAWRGMLE